MIMKKLNIGNLSISVPIIQGGMGVGISLSGLASAVANEGGVGVISSAGLGLLYRNMSKDYIQASIMGLKEELRKAREKTKGVIGVNVMVAMSNFADMVKTAIAEKADIIFSGAGLPLNLPSFLQKDSVTKLVPIVSSSFLQKDSVTKLVPIVSSARAAKVIAEKWHNLYNYLPDAFVVEGPKAGGHLGFKDEQINDEHFSLEHILPEVIAEVKDLEVHYGKDIPVIVAGGIYTGEDIKRFMDMGAAGVQMGTRFVTTDECDASDIFKQTYIEAKQEDIQIIKSPVGMPGRAIFSKFIQKVKEGQKQPKTCMCKCIKTCDISKSPYCIIAALYNAFKGNMDNGYAFAGANAFRATKIVSVKETFRALLDEFSRSGK